MSRFEAGPARFVLHLGDFIYELVWYPEDRATYYDRKVREIVRYPQGEKIDDFHIPVDVNDYRAVYRAYLHDPDLQDARARFPLFPCRTTLSTAGKDGKPCKCSTVKRAPRKRARSQPCRHFLSISRHGW